MTFFKRKKLFTSMALALAVQSTVLADDTDIYINARPVSDAEPMIFLTIDYRSNLGSTTCNNVTNASCASLLGDAYDELLTLVPSGQATLFDAMRAVFQALFDELEGVKVALAMNHDDSCSGRDADGGPSVTGCSNGGYIVRGLQSFDATDSNGAKAAMLSAMASMPQPTGSTSHSYQGKELYFEIFRYLTGQDWHNMQLGWSDYGTNSSRNLPTDNAALSWDTSIVTGSSYDTPFINTADFACSQAYGVNIMFQVSNQDSDADVAINETIVNGGMNLGIARPDFEDVLSYMYQTDMANGNGTWPDIDGEQNFQSYFIASQVNNTTNGYAAAGGTVSAFELNDPSQLLEDLRLIFREILSVSTTFVAASVPVNVFNRSEVIDNVYLAQFAVDANARPYWNGNLKKLKIEESTDANGTTTIRLVDADAAAAISADGRISTNALTFWTDAAELPAPVDDEVAGKDGRSVTRGGAGQKIPGFLPGGSVSIGDNNGVNTRRVFTEPNSGTALIDLGVSNAATLRTDLGAANVAAAETLIQWVRGQDVDDVDGDGDLSEARPWIMGPPLHSRPLPINYGARSAGYSSSNPDIRIFMGTDDGFMHSFRNTDASAADTGEEDWAFMPRSVMDKMSVLRTNSASVAHPYTVDGAPAAFILDTDADGTIGKDSNGAPDATDKAYLYFGLRRGGKAYYAMNVTDPDNPSMLWSIDQSGDFSELGMTFSAPRVGYVQYGASQTPAIFFGGGYDTNKDSGSTNDSEGNAIYVVNAETGALIWKVKYGGTTQAISSTEYQHAGMVDSIPSDVTVVDSNANGVIDRLYVGDTGGTVWRIDLPESTVDNRSTAWFATELANLGGDDIVPVVAVNDRRFFHRPDFVPSSDEFGAFDGVIIGSGDRANPRDTGTTNWLYMLKDRNVNSGTVAGSAYNTNDYDGATNPNGLGDITNTCINSTSCFASENLTNGWKLELEETGEKVLAPALTAFGTIFFTSFLPDGTAAQQGSICEPTEGAGRVYAISILDGSPINNYDTTDGNDAGLTKTDRFNPLTSGGIPAEVVPVGNFILPPDLDPESTGGRLFWKTFWYEKNVDSL